MKYICATFLKNGERKCNSQLCDLYVSSTKVLPPNCKQNFGKFDNPSEQCPAFEHNFVQVEIVCNVIKTFDKVGPEEEKLFWKQLGGN